jgi:hypothetical protein
LPKPVPIQERWATDEWPEEAWERKSPGADTSALHEASIFAVEFDEKLHPRDRKGRFRKNGGLPDIPPFDPLARWYPRPAGPGKDSWWRDAPGTREEYASANRYIARDWNHALRVHSDDQLPRFIKDETDKVASLIDKQPNQPKGKHFWRGLSTSGLLDPNTLKVGDEIKDDGFLSVTEDLSLAAAFEEHSLAHGGSEGVMLRINLTKPKPAFEAQTVMRKEEDEGFFDGQFQSYDEFEDYLWSEMVFARHSKMVVTGVGEMDVPVAEWPDPPTAETRKVKVLDVDLS